MPRYRHTRVATTLLLLSLSLISGMAGASVDLSTLASRIESACAHPKANQFYLAVREAIAIDTPLNRQSLENYSDATDESFESACDLAVLHGKNDVLIDALQHPAQARTPLHSLEGMLAIVRLKMLTLQGPPFPKAAEDDIRRLITASVNDTKAFNAKVKYSVLGLYDPLIFHFDFISFGTPAQQLYWYGFITPYFEAALDERKHADLLPSYDTMAATINEFHDRIIQAGWLYHVETLNLPNRDAVLHADIEQQLALLEKLGKKNEQDKMATEYLTESQVAKSLAFSYAALGDLKHAEQWAERADDKGFGNRGTCFHGHMASLVADRQFRLDPVWYHNNFDKACSSIKKDDDILRQFTVAPVLAANLEKVCSTELPREYLSLQGYIAEDNHHDFDFYLAARPSTMPDDNSYTPSPAKNACMRSVLEGSRTMLTFYRDHMRHDAYSYSSVADDLKKIEDGLARLSVLDKQ